MSIAAGQPNMSFPVSALPTVSQWSELDPEQREFISEFAPDGSKGDKEILAFAGAFTRQFSVGVTVPTMRVLARTAMMKAAKARGNMKRREAKGNGKGRERHFVRPVKRGA